MIFAVKLLIAVKLSIEIILAVSQLFPVLDALDSSNCLGTQNFML